MLSRLLPICCVLLALVCTPAWAMLSERVWEQLSEIHEQISEDQLDEARSALDSLAGQVSDNSHEAARVLEARARLHEVRGEADTALELIGEALAIKAIPDDLRLHLEYARARLLVEQGEFETALARLDDWFEAVASPAPRAWMLRALIYLELERADDAIAAARSAIDMASQPRADWYGFLAAALMREELWSEARAVLQNMLRHWPLRARYWEQLAVVQLQLEDPAGALTTLRAADAAGLLARESAIVRLVRLAMMEGLPAPGARLLEQALEAELIEGTDAHLELLADAWLMAREWALAMAVLEQLATGDENGDTWLRIARLAFERQQPQAAVGYGRRALDAGVDNPSRAWLLKGMAHIELNQYEEAAHAFEQASEDEAVARQAGQWLRYIEAIDTR